MDAGIVVTKYDHVKGEIPSVDCYEAGHPVPDENSFHATEKTLKLVQGLAKDDTVLFLLSGGGSALFEMPLIHGGELQQITGSVRELCAAAAVKCKELGYEPILLTDQLCCEASQADSFLGSILRTHGGYTDSDIESSRSAGFSRLKRKRCLSCSEKDRSPAFFSIFMRSVRSIFDAIRNQMTAYHKQDHDQRRKDELIGVEQSIGKPFRQEEAQGAGASRHSQSHKA